MRREDARMRIILGGALLVVVGLHENRASASEASDARAHFEKGWVAQNLGRFEEAVLHYRAAYAIQPSPALLFNLGQLYRELKNCEQAAFFYRRYLASAKENAPYVNEVTARIRELEAQCEELQRVQGRPPKGALEPKRGGHETDESSETSPVGANHRAAPSGTDAGARTEASKSTRLGLWPFFAIGTGAGLLGGGALLVAIHKPQTAGGVEQADARSTRAPGIGLLATGAGLVALGLVLLAVDGMDEPSVTAGVAPSESGWLACVSGVF